VFDTATLGEWLSARQRNLAFIGVWVMVFGAMSASREWATIIAAVRAVLAGSLRR
jgi:hypothetical protein